jgi:energy-converting hydrogenase A subunit M
MPNIKIISRMLWNRVSISDLAEKLDITVDEVVDMLNTKMTVMERYEVLSAISK